MFHAGQRTTFTRPSRSATRRASNSSLQMSTDKSPHAERTTVRASCFFGSCGTGRNDTGAGRLASSFPSSCAGRRFVHGHVATDMRGPGRTAKTWFATYGWAVLENIGESFETLLRENRFAERRPMHARRGALPSCIIDHQVPQDDARVDQRQRTAGRHLGPERVDGHGAAVDDLADGVLVLGPSHGVHDRE